MLVPTNQSKRSRECLLVHVHTGMDAEATSAQQDWHDWACKNREAQGIDVLKDNSASAVLGEGTSWGAFTKQDTPEQRARYRARMEKVLGHSDWISD